MKWVKSGATLSDDGRCRFALWRSMPKTATHNGTALWLGMNPSTADAAVDDATIRREWGFTTRFGMHYMIKVNVSPYRATNPRDIVVLPEEYRRNVATVLHTAPIVSRIILAHGALPKPLLPWWREIMAGLVLTKVPLVCLGLTLHGHPRHPLYLRSDTAMQPYVPPTDLFSGLP